MSRFSLEKYGANTRFTCPACGQARKFARYIDADTGNRLADDVGKCDRAVKCGYHRTPKQHFADNPQIRKQMFNRAHTVQTVQCVQSVQSVQSIQPVQPFSRSIGSSVQRLNAEHQQPDVIPDEFMTATWCNYERNGFVQFLKTIFDPYTVNTTINTFLFGTTRSGETVFWQFGRDLETRTGKIIRFDAQSGKRDKTYTGFAHARLKKQGKLPEDFNLRQCLFGEHLVATNPEINVVAIVEAEKTACICQPFFPDVIFTACGGITQLNAAKLGAVKDKQLILCPDANGFKEWSQKAEQLTKDGFNVRVSGLIEERATPEQKECGYDFADYLIEQRRVESKA